MSHSVFASISFSLNQFVTLQIVPIKFCEGIAVLAIRVIGVLRFSMVKNGPENLVTIER